MIKRLVKNYTGEKGITKDGKEFDKFYFYLELENGTRLYCDFYGEKSKAAANLICEVEGK